MNTISTALSGMNAASLELATSAHNIANTQTPGYRRQIATPQAAPAGGVTTTITHAGAEGPAMAEDFVAQLAATYAFKANLRVLQTQDRVIGSLLSEIA